MFCLVLYTTHAASHIFLVWNLRGAIIIPLFEGQKTQQGVEKHTLGDVSKGLNLLMSRVRFCPWNIQILPLFSASVPLPSSEAFILPPVAYSWIYISLAQDESAYLLTVVNHNHTHCVTSSCLSPYISLVSCPVSFNLWNGAERQILMAPSSVYSYILSQASLSQTS